MKKPLSAKHQAKASTVHFVPKIFPITPTTHTATHTNTQAHTHTPTILLLMSVEGRKNGTEKCSSFEITLFNY